MKTFIQTTRIINNEQQLDLNFLQLQKFKNPLIVCTRSGQIGRVNEWLRLTHKFEVPVILEKVTVLGWWQLKEQDYLDKDFYLNHNKWKQHDAVFFLDPQRAYNPEAFHKLIRTVSEIV